ncbi:uncharacterized protein [Physcomitrium patens]
MKEEDTTTLRLGCLHNFHTNCLQVHLENFPPHTAPAGFVCPSCPTAVWPPNKYFKESGSALYNSLREFITQVSVAKVLLGADAAFQSRETPPAFSTPPLAEISTSAGVSSESDGVAATVDAGSATVSDNLESNPDNSEGPLPIGVNVAQDVAPRTKTNGSTFGSTNINIISPESRFSKASSANQSQPGATTRKHAMRIDRSQSGNYVEHDDKYSKRGPAYKNLLKFVPFFSSSLPTLPVSVVDGEEVMDDRRRRRYRSSTVDVRKLILLFAIMSCMATAMLLYYRLSQSAGFTEDADSDEQ